MTAALPFHPLLEPVRVLHRRIRDDVVRACEEAAVGTLSGVATEAEGDTIYEIDRVAEQELVAEIGRTIATRAEPVLLVAEGLAGGEVVVPEGADRKNVQWVIIVDPIDGTRGVMYQKRPAWILTGVARGPGPCTLADINSRCKRRFLRQATFAGRALGGSEAGRVCRARQPAHGRNRASDSPSFDRDNAGSRICHDFAIPESSRALAIDDEVIAAVSGPPKPGKRSRSRTNMISTGGQLYERLRATIASSPISDRLRRRRAGGARLLSPIRSLHGTDRAGWACW
jgi:hypothetical protein